MFFAETLGPSITPRKAEALFAFLKSKTRSRKSTSAAELQQIAAEFVRLDGSRVCTEAAIKFLANRGRTSALRTPAPSASRRGCSILSARAVGLV